MGSKKEYIKNRERVYTIYGIDKDKRSNTWNVHHIRWRSNGGSDEKSNLFPVPKSIHRQLHKEEVDNDKLHKFIETRFNGDPYERK